MIELSKFVNMYCSSPILLDRSNMEKANYCQVSNDAVTGPNYGFIWINGKKR